MRRRLRAVVGNRRLKGPKGREPVHNEAGRAAYTAVDPASRSRLDATVAVERGSLPSSGGGAHGRRQTVAADRGRWSSSPASRGRKCCTAGTSGRLQPEGADRGRRSRKRQSTTTERPRTTRSEWRRMGSRRQQPARPRVRDSSTYPALLAHLQLRRLARPSRFSEPSGVALLPYKRSARSAMEHVTR